ncbi:DUF817 domain-containing protein [Oleiagrimonas sp. C23AA]|nr:DUF817 domain-containing protein [Oleiagrimonas sp. C23AA]NII12063.1 DUF817 domain-containing protein [Oleiagrimonas sp. C23AA]
MSVRGWQALDGALSRRARAGGRVGVFAHELLVFGLKQAWACLFGGLMLAMMLAARAWWPADAPLARNDAMTLGALAIQALMLMARLETRRELVVIVLFHVVGTAMELFKTATGSWLYAAGGVLHVGAVPLFTGFMYAAVGSYIARAWRVFSFRFTDHPRWSHTAWLALAIYANFFTDHYGVDMRALLLLAMGALFARTQVHFRVRQAYRRMPLLLGFVLVALFIWLAENVGTFLAVWRYPGQAHGWHPVPVSKLGAWLLLMSISYVMVSALHRHRLGLNRRRA